MYLNVRTKKGLLQIYLRFPNWLTHGIFSRKTISQFPLIFRPRKASIFNLCLLIKFVIRKNLEFVFCENTLLDFKICLCCNCIRQRMPKVFLCNEIFRIVFYKLCQIRWSRLLFLIGIVDSVVICFCRQKKLMFVCRRYITRILQLILSEKNRWPNNYVFRNSSNSSIDR